MAEYAITTTRVAVHRTDESPLFGESTIFAELEDEGAGIYLTIRDTEGKPGELSLDVEAFDRLVEAVKLLTGTVDVETGLMREPEG